jgi:carbonic anhydrase
MSIRLTHCADRNGACPAAPLAELTGLKSVQIPEPLLDVLPMPHWFQYRSEARSCAAAGRSFSKPATLRGGFVFRELRAIVRLGVLMLCATSAVAQNPSTVSADRIWNDLAVGNHRFVLAKTTPHDFLVERKTLVTSQHPRVAVLSCSDSRVPPELVFDVGLGELFVVRSAGEDDDPLSIGSLEYAVEHLGSSVIVVMGHQSCGAVTAACSGEKSGSPNLDAVVGPIAPSCAKVDPGNPESLNLAVRDHVHRVAQELLDRSEMLKKAVVAGKLTIIEAYYSLETGEVSKLR